MQASNKFRHPLNHTKPMSCHLLRHHSCTRKPVRQVATLSAFAWVAGSHGSLPALMVSHHRSAQKHDGNRWNTNALVFLCFLVSWQGKIRKFHAFQYLSERSGQERMLQLDSPGHPFHSMDHVHSRGSWPQAVPAQEGSRLQLKPKMPTIQRIRRSGWTCLKHCD